jgi:protein-disulfide isomerase
MSDFLRRASRIARVGWLAGGLLCAQTKAPAPAPSANQQANWKTAEVLPFIDFSGLSPAQKATALKLLRDYDCTCGCSMKVAECRIVDPGCAYSRGLANAIVDAIKHGKSEKEALTAAKAFQIQPPPLLENPVVIPTAGAPWIGPANAKITLIEFSDFQCPYCAAAVPEIRAIIKAYPADVKLIFKEFPLEIHSQSDLAAAAGVAAHKQGKFWAMHDAMYAHPEDLTRKAILEMAKKSGLDMERFENDLDSTEVRETVVRDVQDGDRAGVDGTPTIFVNNQRYNGPILMQSLKPVLDGVLKPFAGKQ